MSSQFRPWMVMVNSFVTALVFRLAFTSALLWCLVATTHRSSSCGGPILLFLLCFSLHQDKITPPAAVLLRAPRRRKHQGKRGSLGTQTRNVEPCPPLLSTVTVPLNRSSNRFTICNLSPIPSYWSVVECWV